MIKIIDPNLEDLLGVLWENRCRDLLTEVPLFYAGKSKNQAELKERINYWKNHKLPPNYSLPERLSLGEKRVGWGSYGWKYNHQLVIQGVENGLRFIDTAEGYGFGKVETELGKVLKRLSVPPLILSKFSRNRVTKTSVVSAGKRSRDKLGVDSIFLYQIHWPVWDSIEKQFEGLAILLEEEIIQNVGVCNFSPKMWLIASQLAKQFGVEIRSVQLPLSKSMGYSQEMIRWYRGKNVLTIAHSPFGQKRPENGGKDLKEILQTVDVTIPGTNNITHLVNNINID